MTVEYICDKDNLERIWSNLRVCLSNAIKRSNSQSIESAILSCDLLHVFLAMAMRKDICDANAHNKMVNGIKKVVDNEEFKDLLLEI